MRKAIYLFCPVAVISGCSTITRGSRQDVEVKTNPPGLQARINTQQCITPCTLKNVSRKAEYLVLVHGGAEKIYPLDYSFNFWSTIPGNIWNEIWIGLIIDSISGASFSIEDINLDLGPHPQSQAKAP